MLRIAIVDDEPSVVDEIRNINTSFRSKASLLTYPVFQAERIS